MHNRAFQAQNIDAVYLAFEPTSIKEALAAMKNLAIQGASITIPFKIDVLQYIDKIDELASDIGSVNTLVNRQGIIWGYNTDGYGALMALQKVHPVLEKARILILGNGGSARAIAFTLLLQGASITLAGRDISRVSMLAKDLMKKYNDISIISLDEITREYMADIDIIINTTSVGMSPNTDNTPLRENVLHAGHTVFDIVYTPDMTRLLTEATGRGCNVIKGIEMLLYQGIKQYELWTEMQAPLEIMREALKDALQNRTASISDTAQP
jgi:shikimate dehydrogenase